MKSTAFVLTIAVASLGFSAASLAQGYDRRGERDEPARVQQNSPRQAEQYGQRRYDRGTEQRLDRRDDHNFNQDNMRRNDRHGYYDARGQDFRRGGYIPHEFRNRQYIVNNYRTHYLSPPPYGHQWVQVGPDYVLVAIATGLIANIILNH